MKQFYYKRTEFKDLNESCLQSSILRTVAYFSVFNYPLRFEEIYEYIDQKDAEPIQLRYILESLCKEGIINKSGLYYYLGHESCIQKRIESNRYSEQLMKKALKYVRIISFFPFVKSISISGSLSKKSADKNADVDYFIITKQNRLWICRTMLAVFKKVFLLNSSKYFCINYFVDSANLEIKEKNIYTATEIAFLIPVYHHENFFRFLASNSWINTYYPRKKVEINENMEAKKDVFLKKAIEYLLDNKMGNILDNIFLKINIFYKRLKFSQLNEREYERNLRSTKGVSKHHPNSYQERVLRLYHEKLSLIKSIARLELN